jgi:hypothetical protein
MNKPTAFRVFNPATNRTRGFATLAEARAYLATLKGGYIADAMNKRVGM